ncbi:hypothetical protein [Noviherbaspirillum massiliense]|uniref:hypothetical protein n=1 Tax=Noviherbaspirillum massiliense TaxID=1465823 RepID=UPI0002DEF73B|nr:hypothetical protein [Noviherbaspirillum massiliense]
MATETIGNYQLDLTAEEISGGGGWRPYLTALRFDEESKAFKCVLHGYRACEETFSTYPEAIEKAREVANTLIESGRIEHLS